MSNDALRFPVGKFSAVPDLDMAGYTARIDQIAQAPGVIAGLVTGLTPAQLATPYRDGGWTGAQVVHHMADSHANAYLRTRFALAEDGYVVKPYNENRWAEFPDAMDVDVSGSLDILRGLHARWAALLRTLGPDAYTRPLLHPERGPMTLGTLVQLYAWHGRHHAGHLELIRSTLPASAQLGE